MCAKSDEKRCDPHPLRRLSVVKSIPPYVENDSQALPLRHCDKSMINGTFYLQLFEDIVDILDPEMNLDPDEDFSDQLDEEEEEEEEMDEGQGSPKEKDEDVVKSEGGQSQR